MNRNARVRWGPETLAERPELALAAMQAIAEWAETEAELASLFAALIGAPFSASTAAFFALTSGPGQLAAMEAFAEEHLVGTTLDIFRAVILIYRRQHKSRNCLAHWRYAVSDNIPEALMLMSQSEHKRVESANLDAHRRAIPGQPLMTDNESNAINERVLRSIYVYRLEDLTVISQNAIQIKLWITRMVIAFGTPDPIRESILLPLLDEPMILEEVAKRQNQGRKSP